MKLKINLYLKKISDYKYTPVIFFILWFLLFIAISFFRDSRLDENIYIGDSVEIANILQRGEWIGNYGVGMHGFLNKFIVGAIFVLTGPSVFIATLTNILFALGSGIVFFKILFKHLKFSKTFSLLGVTLLFSSYQFLTYTPTFYRDIPALFFVLLVIYSILEKKSKWLTGLFLLLLLDSKEHVFYTIGPAFVLWIAIESYLINKRDYLKGIKDFVLNGFKLFLPSLLFLILMFTTSIIPLNIYNANILGLIDGGLESMSSNFDLEAATYNRDAAVNVDIARVMPTFPIPIGASTFTTALLSFVNVILSYCGKILYPRTFSFLSIPFIVLIPSLWFAYRYFIENLRKRESTKLILPILLFVYLSVYILHASISRYILPISPVIFLFFLMFLRDLVPKHIYTKKVLILTFIFIVAGLYFEYSYVSIKIVINILLFSILVLISFGKKIKKENLKILLILIISSFSIGTALLASYSYGQIKGYRMYGYNRECEEIVSLVNKEERIWINDIYWDRLPFVLRRENLGQPEWRWSLKGGVPKKKLLLRNTDFNTYNFYWGEISEFKEEVYKNKIQKVVYVKLEEEFPKEELLLQNRLKILLEADWLILINTIMMENKQIYILDVYRGY